ncbi:iron(III) transport system ATP-binding protein [Pararhizobium capsulatum DSM 1112]|uniref:Iron(III) transport system ATP-binding protein n=1 Tax=Pararhizobium capsulatum DSM 1112 TaxID=1121113 RepID=A0ABU0BZV7_9HYPH|nr:ABC transporter ATP-binding protein [Pararhizobium capsulatum]MDQ0323779.1 iron(III) transport system ATP-binding protein [Pararhizobium capsulatum DSM 1112]
MLDIRNLTKRFGAFTAVDDINLSVPDGAFLVLLGPSGCGKTTLLRMLAGLEQPTAGQIEFDGVVVSDGDRNWNVDPANRNSGLVFQSYALWPHMTVRGNVEWPLKVAGMGKAERKGRVEEVMALLGIGELQARYPNEISGGQQQRVAIARTIAPRPGVLLFDEPLSNLDAKLRVEMRSELMRLHRTIGATSVYVTHDQIEAMTMATHVAVINRGRIEQFGSPEDLVRSPASAFVATFVGTPPNNIVPITRHGSAYKVHTQVTDLAPPMPQASLAMYPPECLTVHDEMTPGSFAMELVEISVIAGRTMVTASDGALRLTAIVDRPPKARLAERVHMRLPTAPACWFDAQGRRIPA